METIASEADLQIAASSDAAAERGPEPEGRTPVGVWLQPALIALVLASAFIACYIGLQRDATPHHLPVAVLGSQLSEQVQNTLGDAVTTQPSGSAAAAHTALEDRDVVAVLAQEAPGRLVLHVAGANGLSTTTAVENLLTAYAHRAGQGLSITDDVPLVAYDSRGLAGFYLAFGVTLAGFVLAQNTLALSARMRLRHRLTLIVACSAAVGLVGAILAGPMLGAVPAPFAPPGAHAGAARRSGGLRHQTPGLLLRRRRRPDGNPAAADRWQLDQWRDDRGGPAARGRPGGLRGASAGSSGARNHRPELLQRSPCRPRAVDPGPVGAPVRGPGLGQGGLPPLQAAPGTPSPGGEVVIFQSERE